MPLAMNQKIPHTGPDKNVPNGLDQPPRKNATATAETREVAEILMVPFRIFLDPSRLRTQQMQRLGKWIDVYFYSYESQEIWGLTARIIKDFLDVVAARNGS